jgi:triacylglycerol esterase/lipase EstA (alpha/beta hydrolase family)
VVAHSAHRGDSPVRGTTAIRPGFTPVYLRYNTGLHISHNGQTLAELLNRLHVLWPAAAEEPLKETVLVGHSMGGLVARACHYGLQQRE